MQNPAQDVEGVVKGLVEAKTAEEQKTCIQRYFSPDASFDHPLCSVVSSPNSRDDRLLPIYQWLRVMSNSKIVVHSVGFDQGSNKCFLDATQSLIPTLWPLAKLYSPDARIVVVLHLQRGGDGKFYIKRQEDIYQLQVLPGLIFPLIGPLAINTMKRIAGFNCAILAAGARGVGIWNPESGKGKGKKN